MAKKQKRQFTIVHEHPRRVPVSGKNPDGVTIVDQHPRRLPGTTLTPDEILSIARTYDLKNLVFPTAGKLIEFKNADKYDDLIAIWTDYFNQKLNLAQKFDPDVVKALIASESEFKDAPRNPQAIGIAQVTKATLKIVQDPSGEAKDFIFSKIRQKDLNNPEIAIPIAVRWLFRKREQATSKLKRQPTPEEIILEYKGLLRSNTEYRSKALKNFRNNYALLKEK